MYLESPVTDAERARLIADLQQELHSPADRQLALQALDDLVHADGFVSAEDRAVVAEIREAIDAIDFGFFYWLTKPLFLGLLFLHKYLGNLGISILVFSSTLANGVWDAAHIDIQMLRPGLVLVILGQFSFIATIATLVISARLQKFDPTLEEAALNLGAGRLTAVRTITLPYLAPALIGAFVVAFLMSFENFNTTLMLVGSDAPLTIAMFDRLKEGSTPLLNAVSLLLMLGSSLLALVMILFQRRS